jgi:hypothetical protein
MMLRRGLGAMLQILSKARMVDGVPTVQNVLWGGVGQDCVDREAQVKCVFSPT